MKSRALLGKEVVGARGWRIGRVKDLLIDENTWKLRAIEVQLHRPVAEEYRMKRLLTRSTIEISTESVHAIGDHVMLTVTKPELRQIVSSSAARPRRPEPSSSA